MDVDAAAPILASRPGLLRGGSLRMHAGGRNWNPSRDEAAWKQRRWSPRGRLPRRAEIDDVVSCCGSGDVGAAFARGVVRRLLELRARVRRLHDLKWNFFLDEFLH